MILKRVILIIFLSIPFSVNIFALDSIDRIFLKIPHLVIDGPEEYPNYCIDDENGQIARCKACYNPSKSKFEIIKDDKNGFLQIIDMCPDALSDGSRTQLNIFTTDTKKVFLINSLWILAPAYSHSYYLRAFSLQNGNIVPIDLASLMPKLSAEYFMSESYNKDELKALRHGFKRTDMAEDISHSDPYFAYTLPRYGTNIYVDVDMNIWIRGEDPQISEVAKLQKNFLRIHIFCSHQRYLLYLFFFLTFQESLFLICETF